MKTFIAFAVALSAAVVVTPVSAGPNESPLGAAAQKRAAAGDLSVAIANAHGTLARGEGGVSSADGAGSYEVVSGRDVAACVYSVDIGSPADAAVVTTVIGRNDDQAL